MIVIAICPLLISFTIGGGTIRKMGTSMAAPHVTGVVALMFEKNQALTSGDVKNIIEQSAEAIGIAPYDSPITEYVFDGVREGVVNAEDAVLNTP